VQKWCAITYLGKEKVFDTTAEFAHWFLNEYEHEDKKSKKITIIAHNGKAFDHYYILGYILEKFKFTAEKIQTVCNGAKLMYIQFCIIISIYLLHWSISCW